MGYLIIMIIALSIYGFQSQKSGEGLGSTQTFSESETFNAEERCRSEVLGEQDLKLAKQCFMHQVRVESYPWGLGDCLNFEEVFKNHQYYEVYVLEQKSRVLVKKFIAGQLESSVQYAVNSDKKLLGPCQNLEK